MTFAQDLTALGAGSIVGLLLGLVGGGGSILAVPLLVYAVGVTNPHVAIGTGAVAVAASALANLALRARSGLLKWRCASVFAAAGIAGALGGALAGRQVDGQALLALFAVLMFVVGALMLKNRKAAGQPTVRLNRTNLPKLLGFGAGAGVLSGFFGVGGGFLVVPGLMRATGMPIAYAAVSSLIAVAAFGATTAASYAFAGLVNWPVAALFVAGGAAGGVLGGRAARRLGEAKGALTTVFAGLIFLVAGYTLFQSFAPGLG